MALTFREADEVAAIAGLLIENHHSHLLEADIRWLFTSGAKSAARVAGSLLRYLASGTAAAVEAGPDFLILVTNDDWSRLSKRGRKAMVDELLSQCGQETNQTTGEDKWVINRPDVQTFREVIARHGLWTQELRELGATMDDLPQQLRLVLEDEAPAAVADDQVEEDDPTAPEGCEVCRDGGPCSVHDGDEDEPVEADPDAVSRIHRAVEVGARA